MKLNVSVSRSTQQSVSQSPHRSVHHLRGRLLLILASVGLSTASLVPAQAVSAQWVERSSLSRQERAPQLAARGSTLDSLLQLTNAERSRANLASLSINPELARAAQRHADDMARSGEFSHRGSDGSSMGDRVKATNYRYRTIGENLMLSPRNNPGQAVDVWMDSDGHRKNILNGQFSEVGLGYATDGRRHYYVQVFGRPVNSVVSSNSPGRNQTSSDRPSRNRPRPQPVAQAAGNQVGGQNATINRLFLLTNQARERARVGRLSLSGKLNAAAQKHAEDMARTGRLSHTGSNGSSMGDRIKAENYRFRRAAENVAYRAPFDDPEATVEGWLGSSGHRRNMLNGQFTEMGLGYATDGERHYYVQVFGTPR